MGTRDDGSSQGGCLVFLVDKDMLEGKEGTYIFLDWRSAKLTRMSRSSLISEPQAAAMGVDSLEYVKTSWALVRYPDADPREDSIVEIAGLSALAIDAKASDDAAQKEHAHNFVEKRIEIEVMVLKDRMRASQTGWRWVSRERHFADGVTKVSARQALVDRLRSSMCVLQHDPNFIASTKKSAIQRQEQNQHRRTNAAATTTPATASTPPASKPDESTALVTTTATSKYTLIPASARPWVPKYVKRDRDRRDRLSVPWVVGRG